MTSFRWLEIVRQKDAEIARLRKELKALSESNGVRIIDAIKTTDDRSGEGVTMLAIEIVEEKP